METKIESKDAILTEGAVPSNQDMIGVAVVKQCEAAKIKWHNKNEQEPKENSPEADNVANTFNTEHSYSTVNLNIKSNVTTSENSHTMVTDSENIISGAGDDMDVEDQSEAHETIIETPFNDHNDNKLGNQHTNEEDRKPGLSESLIQVFPLETPYESDDDDLDDDKRTYHCEICECSCTGKDCFDKHLSGARHAKNVKNKEAGLPMAKGKSSKGAKGPKDPDLATALARCKDPIIGLKCIIEWVHESDHLLEPTYSCELCGNKFDLRMVTSHLTGRNHRMNYMKENYTTWYKEMNEKLESGATKQEETVMILERVEEIVKLEPAQTYQSRKSEEIPPNAKRIRVEPDPSQILPPVPQLNGYVHDFDRVPDFYPDFTPSIPQAEFPVNEPKKKENNFNKKGDNAQTGNKRKITPLLKSTRDFPSGRFEQLDNIRSAWGSKCNPRYEAGYDPRMDSWQNSSQYMHPNDYPQMHNRHPDYDYWSEEQYRREQFMREREKERFSESERNNFERNLYDRRPISNEREIRNDRASEEKKPVIMRPSVWIPTGEIETALNGPPMQLDELMRKIIKKLDDDTICTDDEAKLAQQVLNLLSDNVKKYNLRNKPSKEMESSSSPHIDAVPNHNVQHNVMPPSHSVNSYVPKNAPDHHNVRDMQPQRSEIPSLLQSNISSHQTKAPYHLQTSELSYGSSAQQAAHLYGIKNQAAHQSSMGYHGQNMAHRQSEMASRSSEMVSRSSEMIPRSSEMIPRSSEMIPRSSEMVSRSSENMSRQAGMALRQSEMVPRQHEMASRHSEMPSRQSEMQHSLQSNNSHQQPKVSSQYPGSTSYGSSLLANARAIAGSQQQSSYSTSNNPSQYPKPVIKSLYPEVGVPNSTKNPYPEVGAPPNYPIVGSASGNSHRAEVKPIVRVNDPRMDFRADPRIEIRQDTRETYAGRQNYAGHNTNASIGNRDMLSLREGRNNLSHDFANSQTDRNSNASPSLNYSSPLSQLHPRKSVL